MNRAACSMHDLLAQHRALQRRPARTAAQQVAQVDQQRAAVGAVQAPGLISRKSVTSVPCRAMCSMRPTRLLASGAPPRSPERRPRRRPASTSTLTS